MPEIQDIFSSIKPSGLSLDHKKAFFAISNCRTSTLGSHLDSCDSCSNIEISYNSCRNRHCPKCQGSKQKDWVEAQLSKLLPIGYFHVVFTLPKELNSLIFHNQRLMYAILLKSAGDTLVELAKDSKFLGAQTGVTSVLHTWGQNLSFHPHVHCIVPGGGLSKDGLRFIPSSKKFFLPVRVVSRKFRGKFLSHLKKAWVAGELLFFKDTKELNNELYFLNFLNGLYQKEWVVYCKKPFKSPWHVMSYLGRYTHRVAISNSRIMSFDGDTVTFKWKDYKDHNRAKLMSLDAEEFARRFLLHVLPSGFTKIRHYGLLASRNVGTKLLLCLRLIGLKPFIPQIAKYVKACPQCGGTMVFNGSLDQSFAEP
jgi:hypothetical protein